MMLNYPEFLKNIPLNFNYPDDSDIFSKNCTIIAVGKSASFMYDRFISSYPDLRKLPAIIITPFKSQIPQYSKNVQIVFSTHPLISAYSFQAFEKLKKFIFNSNSGHITVLLSGGSSALIEKSFDMNKTVKANSELLRSGLSIMEINRIRIENSLIKGGKLAQMHPDVSWTVFVMSDIPFENGELFVGSNPFFRTDLKNTKLVKSADSDTLHDELLKMIGNENTFSLRKFNRSVSELAEIIIRKIDEGAEKILITGEPTLKISSNASGTGGRMTHLALTLLSHLPDRSNFYALSSDGIDGNSPFAGAVVKDPETFRTIDGIDHAIQNYNSGTFLSKHRMTIKTGYTGINLNDFVIFKRL